MGGSNILVTLSVIALPLIFAITLHEAMHGYAAKRLGDNTAFMLGRVTLNPIKHIDPIGTIILPAVMLILNSGILFGWAKPVPVNWSNLRNPRRDMALVALAGPFSNLVMAFLWAGVAKIAMTFGPVAVPAPNTAFFFLMVGKYGILINSLLFLLNLIPIPPLDGSRVVSAILPPRLARKYDLIEPYGIWILLGILILFGRLILGPPVMHMMYLISRLFGLT